MNNHKAESSSAERINQESESSSERKETSKSSRQTRHRKYLLTINNPIDNGGFDHELIKGLIMTIPSIIYFAICDEIGKEGTFHTHIYLHFDQLVRFSTIKDLFPTAHIDPAKGTADQNRTYLLKEGRHRNKECTSVDGSFFEWGEPPYERQGARNDNKDMLDMIYDNVPTLEIINTNPNLAFRVSQIEKLKSEVRRQASSSKAIRELKVTYIWGDTATGKTYQIFQDYAPEDVCLVSQYERSPFDEYDSQKVLVLDEFSGQVPIETMNRLADQYPFTLPARYNNRPALYNHLIVISNFPISELYSGIATSKQLEAFRRRFQEFYHYTHDSIIFYKNHDDALRRTNPQITYRLSHVAKQMIKDYIETGIISSYTQEKILISVLQNESSGDIVSDYLREINPETYQLAQEYFNEMSKESGYRPKFKEYKGAGEDDSSFEEFKKMFDSS